MADAVDGRLSGTTLDAVAAAIEAAGMTQSGRACFGNRLQSPAGTERANVAAMTGKVAYRLGVALHAAGIIDRIPVCARCERPRRVNREGWRSRPARFAGLVITGPRP